MPKVCGIYRILRLDTAHEYIGHSSDMTRRWAAHRRLLNAGQHHAPKLQHAWAKYGPDAFAFEVLEICDRSELVEREQHHFDNRKPWFNAAPVAGSRLGVPQSPETRKKIAAAVLGREKTEETRRRLSAALSGRKLSPEHCAKIRQIKSETSDETRARMSAAQSGKRHSAETRLKMSKAHKGRKFTPEHTANISAAQRGRKFSDEHRAKLSAAHKGHTFKHTEETKQKMREAALRRNAERRAAQ